MHLFEPINKNEYQEIYSTNTLFLIDIMRMREINAVYGYKNGNKILKQFHSLFKNKILIDINKYLNGISKKKPYVEFTNAYVDVFALKIYSDLEDLVLLNIKDIIFNNVLTHQFKIKNYGVSITIDIVIGCSKSDDKNLMIYAEKALYNAKTTFENFMYLEPAFNNIELLNTNLLETIRYNIDEKIVEPYFQEIVDSKSMETYKYEALMRLVDKNGSILTPNAFLDKSKKYRLYSKLMIVMIKKVFESIKQHDICASINLDYHDLVDPILKNFILENLKAHKHGKCLTIEILESEKIHDFDAVNDFIKELRKYDVSVAIDDFGTGFSNYEHILQLDIDYIKIDGSLVKRINEDIYYDLIKSIVSFCKKQDIKVVAEFVSNLSILRYVRSLKIDYSQGYYISKPKTINEIIGVDNER